MENYGEQFLHKDNPKLHTSNPVEHEQDRRKLFNENLMDEEIEKETSQKPREKIASWMDVLERTHTGHRDDPKVLERIKDYYHREHVISKEGIPESYYENQKRLAREQGHGDIEITDEMKEGLSDVITSDQASTLDNWLDYFTSSDSDVYPMWAKYWAFTNMLKMSTFDKEKHAFGKRSKGTVAPFVDLNREALAYVVDAINKEAKERTEEKTKEKKEPEEMEVNLELKKLLSDANFAKLYAYAIEKVTPTEQNELLTTEGKWVKYDRESDHMLLVESLQGYGTGWCTAGESTAKVQLQGGDFYVYYSLDKTGKPTIPRVAIRMQGENIGEVRGIASEQNLDPYIGDVAKDKLKEFPDEEKYEKKASDMKRLTEIEKKNNLKEKLSNEDLRFLYEVNSKIEGFGYQKDPRTKEILDGRNMKQDLSLVFNCREDQISTNTDEALKGDVVFHYGQLNLSSLTSAEGLILPQTVGGYLNLRDLTSAVGLTFPQNIGGDLNLSSLISTEGLILPQTIGGYLDLGSLKREEKNELKAKYPKIDIL